jgi:hypothetical protein
MGLEKRVGRTLIGPFSPNPLRFGAWPITPVFVHYSKGLTQRRRSAKNVIAELDTEKLNACRLLSIPS